MHIYPHYSEKTPKKEEDARLRYVAMTRSTDRLLVLGADS